MLRRSLRFFACAIEGVISQANARPVQLRNSRTPDAVKHMHEYVLDNQEAVYTYKWKQESLCEFEVGDKVRFFYDVDSYRGREDNVIVPGSAKLLSKANNIPQPQPQPQLQSDARVGTTSNHHTPSAEEVRVHALDIVKDLMLSLSPAPSGAAKGSSEVPPEISSLLDSVITNTRVVEKYILTGTYERQEVVEWTA